MDLLVNDFRSELIIIYNFHKIIRKKIVDQTLSVAMTMTVSANCQYKIDICDLTCIIVHASLEVLRLCGYMLTNSPLNHREFNAVTSMATGALNPHL